MSNNGKTARGGIFFVEGLALLFIALKLCGVIDWSWVLVLIPIWLPALLIMIVFAVAIVRDKWEQRGTVPCRECKYRGSIVSESFGNVKIRCLMNRTYYPDGHRCREGERVRWKKST